MSRQSDGVPIWHDQTEITADATGLNSQAGYTGTATELNLIAGYTGTTANLNALAGLTATTAELNYMVGHRFTDMTPGTGISTGSGTICEHRVTKVGGLYQTEILIDLTGLNGCGSAGDVIGKDGDTVNCHIGQITAAGNGTIIAAAMYGHEAPAGGNADINVFTSTDATLAQDTAIASGAGQTQLVDAGALTATSVVQWSVMPGANAYLYLTTGAATDADFSAGRMLIVLFGV